MAGKAKAVRTAPVRVAADRISVAARVERSVHEGLVRSAEAHGRTLSEEIERRLTHSVNGANLVADIFSSRSTLRLIEGVARTAELIESDYPGEDWQQNYKLNGELHSAIWRFLAIAMVEDRGAEFFPARTEQGLAALGMGSADYNQQNATIAAEVVAKALGFKSEAPDPLERIRQLESQVSQMEAWLLEHHPEDLDRFRATIDGMNRSARSAGSAEGPQSKPAKPARSKKVN